MTSRGARARRRPTPGRGDAVLPPPPRGLFCLGPVVPSARAFYESRRAGRVSKTTRRRRGSSSSTSSIATSDSVASATAYAPREASTPPKRRRSLLMRVLLGKEPARKLYASTAELKKFLADELRTPLVFLDVDGVLHHAYVDDPKHLFAPSCVAALADAVKRSGARVVLSSSWREQHGRAVLVDDVLVGAGLAPLLAATPSLLVGGRAAEIKSWLKKHAPPSGPPRWVAVDDRYFGGIKAHLIHVDGARGFTRRDADRVVAHLAGQLPEAAEAATPPRRNSSAGRLEDDAVDSPTDRKLGLRRSESSAF